MIRRLATLAALGVVAVAALAATAAARPVPYAVIIGNNAPPVETEGVAYAPLQYADDDAVHYYQLLAQFSRTTLLSTLDDATQKRFPRLAALARVPSLAELRQTFASLAHDMQLDRAAGNDPILYFVFSGHGAIGEAGDPYLALVDGRLTQHVLFDELLASVPATRTHVIVDACHAAGVVGARGPLFGKETTGAVAALSPSESIAIAGGGALDRYPNVGVIVATTLGNETHEWSAIEAGVFSHELLSGLAGPADVNGDQAIEYSELQAFITSANRSIANPRAVPMVIAESPHADRHAPLVRLGDLRQSFLLRGNAGGWGRFSIVTEDGERLVDANASGERAIAVALPRDAAVYLRTATGEARVASGGKPVAIADLRLSAPTVASRGGSVDADYRAHLFASPYGPTYYRGFVDSQKLVSVDFDVHVTVSDAPEYLDLRPPGRSLRRTVGGVALATVAVVSTVVAGVAGAAALEARSQFEHADIRSNATYEADDYHSLTRAFWISTAVTALAGYGSYRLLHHRHVVITPQVAPSSGAPGLSLGGTF